MFKIEMLTAGRWVAVGGTFASKEAAHAKIAEYLVGSAKKKRPSYRVVPTMPK